MANSSLMRHQPPAFGSLKARDLAGPRAEHQGQESEGFSNDPLQQRSSLLAVVKVTEGDGHAQKPETSTKRTDFISARCVTPCPLCPAMRKPRR